MTREEKVLFFAACYLHCADCPYNCKCEKNFDVNHCLHVLRKKFENAFKEKLLSSLYNELDYALESRQEKEYELERKNGLILARLELLDYFRKKTNNE